MKIAFLINNAYGIGGTIRAVANLSRALVARHEVDVVSVHRVADEPAIPLDERVALSSLIDMREDAPTYEGDHPLRQQPCTMFPDTGAALNSARLPYSALQDERIGAWLRDTDADVVIATRPDLNGYLARDGQPRYLRVGQEHLSLATHNPTLRGHQNRAIAGLDAWVTVSEADAAEYRAALPDVGARILCIPNSVPVPVVEQSDRGSNVIVAAGRLIKIKRYDRLIDAFAKVADAHPEWTLRIYGRGPEKPALRARIDELGLYQRILLMGPVSPIETEWAKGAIAAVSSDMESFGMTIVEAMHCGVPVIATDCPHGPAEIIDHDVNGLLVPLESGPDGYAAALDRLMGDAALRSTMGVAARERAATFAPAEAARRYETLFEELSAARRPAKGSLWKRLRNALPTPSAAPRTAVPAEPAEPEPPRPTAHARATADGAVTVVLDAATLPPGEGKLDFLARLRRDSKGRELRVPVEEITSATGGRTMRATLDPAAGHELAEGRWDCYIVRSGTKDKRTRLAVTLAEQARRVGRPPLTAHGHVVSWLPYATTDGFLALRTWQRPAHAEITELVQDEDAATVTARLFTGDAAVALTDAARVVAVSRHDTSHDFTVPVTRRTGETAGDGTCFTFSVPYAQALALRVDEHDLWDLRLHPGGATDGPVPIGRIGGDLVDRKKADTVPAVHLTHPERGRTRTKPFFTVNNDLALSLRDAAQDAEDAKD
ncbi:glycosyltransferase family 4 protein [Streptomyces sp. NPDC046939]|uniref:glycosyltransferase family 4 protein n=1 Tax=Streptomyces sp. NPDC046939 TaxID=3155376 RepID=UPI0033FF85AF